MDLGLFNVSDTYKYVLNQSGANAITLGNGNDVNWNAGGVVSLTGIQTIAGTKTFSTIIGGSINGNAATATLADTATTVVNGSISTSKLGTDAVIENRIKDGAVTEDKIADSAVSPAKLSQPLTRATPVNISDIPATAAINFTSIPSWVKRITIMFKQVSTSSTGNLLIRIGDSGGIKLIGYDACVAVTTASAVTTTDFTNGFGLSNNIAAIYSYSGSFTITNISSNTWVISGSAKQASTRMVMVAGHLVMSNNLNQVQIITSTGTFDSGVISIMYE